jgi:hypothetical protein
MANPEQTLKIKTIGRGINYLGALGAKLRDLQGFSTLAFELIQNADDADGASQIKFTVTDDFLDVENDAQFSDCGMAEEPECHWRTDPQINHMCDFHRFREVLSGDKREQSDTAGAFGVGFTAVYQVTDRPELFSNGRHWSIVEHNPESERIIVCPGCAWCSDKSFSGTRFHLPWAFDPNSALRKALRASAASPDSKQRLLAELRTAVPQAMLFLKQLNRVQLFDGVERILTFERIVVDSSVILNDGVRDTVWHIVSTNFSQEAEKLRDKWPGRIEKKRTAQVRLAIPAEPIRSGLLCAYLPTQHETGLPFHINADFFTPTDRKRVILEADYQSEWNRAALRAGASALALHLSRLTALVGSERTWQIMDATFTSFREAVGGRRDLVFKTFWEEVESALPHSLVAECTDGTFTLPEQAHMLYETEEQSAESVLTAVGLKVLCPEIRQYAFRLPRNAGIRVLDVGHVVAALHRLGLDKRTDIRNALSVLQGGEGRASLLGELERLVKRKNPQESHRALGLVSTCALFLGDDEALWPSKNLFSAEPHSRHLISAVCNGIRFSIGDAHQVAPTVASSVPSLSAAIIIGEFEAGRYQLEQRVVPKLLHWFETHKPELDFARGLKSRLAALPIYPSTAGLKELHNVALPGGFDDPVGVTELVDLTTIPSLRGFLEYLEAKELTFKEYASTFLPKAIRSGKELSLAQKRAVNELLAARLGEIRDSSSTCDELASLALVECSDGHFRKPSEVYFPSDIVRSVLGTSVATARISSNHRDAIGELYRWLGVTQAPRFVDIVQRVVGLANLSVGSGKAEVETIVKHLGERLKDYEGLPSELRRLQQFEWLPAQEIHTRWFKPNELHLTFSKFLFSTQARFLDISQTVQASSVNFWNLLGVKSEPTVRQVVDHLLECSRSSTAVNQRVYDFLNTNAPDPSVLLLRDKPCLMFAEGRYTTASRVFWNPHQFGRFRIQLGRELSKYSEFLRRIGVRENATADDAISVLKEISNEIGRKNARLDEQCHTVVMVCWTMLSSALDSGEITEGTLKSLSPEKVIPAPNGILERPLLMFFEDRAGLASKFPNLLANSVIRYPEHAWRAMSAAGVRPLSEVVTCRIVDIGDEVRDETVSTRLRSRRTQLARVLDPVLRGNGSVPDLEILRTIESYSAKSLLIQYAIDAFNQHNLSDVEDVKAYFDTEAIALYFVSQQDGVPWAAISRELSGHLIGKDESGPTALALMQVLSAPDVHSASALLDELGFPPMEELDITPKDSTPISELGGDWGDVSIPPIAGVQPPRRGESASSIDSSAGTGSATEGFAEGPGPLSEATPSVYAPHSGRPHEGSTQFNSSANGTSSGVGERYGKATDGGETAQPRSSKKRSKFRTYVVNEEVGGSEPKSENTEPRSEVDEAGIRHVCDYETSQLRFPNVMPHENPGFDIKSLDEDGFIVRYIEVKSCSGEWDCDGVAMSKTQFEDAQTHGEVHWLYVVEKATSQDFRIFRIQDPARRVTEFIFDDGWQAITETEVSSTDDNDSSDAGIIVPSESL